MKNFAERFKELRISKGMSQYKLAADIGISRSQIASYENGDRKPGIYKLQEIADYFHVDPNYLLGVDDQLMRRISPDEQRLLAMFADLNDQGRAALQQYAEVLVASDMYKEK